MTVAWEAWLEDRFPGFLLPSSAHKAVSADEATRFLRRMMNGRPDQLRLLRVASLFASPERAEALERFTTRLLPDLVRRLPSTTRVERRVWQGGFQGRLDVRATLLEHMAGQRTTFITRARKRSFDLPESVLVRAVVRRLCAALHLLRKGGLHTSAWGRRVTELGDPLQHMLLSTVLREVSDEPITGRHLQAAKAARHPCYEAARIWHGTLYDALDRDEPARTAKLLAEGALEPAEAETRFEVAVVLRFVEALWQRLEPDGWQATHGLIATKRKDVATFTREGTEISVFYNQVPELPRGPRDRGVRHYFGSHQRWRPDFSVRVRSPGGPDQWTVGEVKYTPNANYMRVGYGEALGYRHEYSEALSGWPKAILVVPDGIVGAPSRDHEVVAVSWPNWPPRTVVAGVLEPAL